MLIWLKKERVTMTKMTKKANLAKLLLTLEEILRKNNMWQKTPAKKELLQSTQPFCHDTLKPEQWLQFVFIAKLEHLLKVGFPLPTNCDITPYIQESLKEHSAIIEITKATKNIDELLNGK